MVTLKIFNISVHQVVRAISALENCNNLFFEFKLNVKLRLKILEGGRGGTSKWRMQPLNINAHLGIKCDGHIFHIFAVRNLKSDSSSSCQSVYAPRLAYASFQSTKKMKLPM